MVQKRPNVGAPRKYRNYFAHLNVIRKHKVIHSFSNVWTFNLLEVHGSSHAMELIYKNVREFGDGALFYIDKEDILVITSMSEMSD